MCTGKTKEALLRQIDACSTIAELFTLVKTENIDMRMQTLCSASNIPPKLPEYDSSASIEDSLVRLKDVVRLAVENQLSLP
ncbi:MAG: hypothetical protein IJ298_06950 [Ruminococcus sp.]|nr:hypothetical protein [Ruminococcus sp.]